MADRTGVAATERSVILPSWADELPSQWEWHQLADVCLEIVDCPHSTPELVEDGPYLMARTPDILTGVFRADEARRVSEATYRERTRRAEPRNGDLLYSREGTYFGIAAEIPLETKVCLGQRMVLLRPDPEQVQPTYLRYWLNSSAIQSHVRGQRDGSVAERLNLPTILGLPVCTPPMAEQSTIAHVLGTLDDKIELNRRMNETLEAIARALFRSWFVDFDPVRAKAEGRDLRLPKSLVESFPDHFDDSQIGAIPSGWRAARWGELVTLEYGKSLDGYEGSTHHYPVYGTNGRIGTYPEPLCDHPGVIIGRKGAYRGVHFSAEPFFVIDTAFYVEPRKSIELRWVYYELLRQDINSMDSGSAIPSTSRGDFYGMSVIEPPLELQRAFVRFMTPCWSRQEQGEREQASLAALRDTLLPKLISGELRIKDAVRIVGHLA